MRPALVYEDQPLWFDRRSQHHSPSWPIELVAFGGYSSPFFLVGPMRAVVRYIVERLTESLVMTSK
jgi:hypothetical protein